MTTEAFATLVAAMIDYLQSVGISRSQLAKYTDVSTEQLAAPGTAFSPSQLQRLWQLIQTRVLPTLTFSVSVRPLIAEQLSCGPVRVDTVATRLHMSRHTLYKKLKLENLTFATLVDEIRREQAMVLLKERERPLVEVAELLGFSELSAFCRAFKRWMGQTPGAFRQAIV